MSIGTAKAKRIDPGHALSWRAGKGFQLGGDAQLESFKIDVGIGRVEMQTGGDLTVLEDEHCFDQPGHACGCFQMAEICFG